MRKRFAKPAVALLVAAFLVIIGWWATSLFLAEPAPRPEIVDLSKIRAFGAAAHLFATQNDGRLPGVEEWEQYALQCFNDPDLLQSSVLASSGRVYAMNEHLSSVRLGDIPDAGATVLFFECAPGSPQGGGPELLPPSPRYPGGYLIGFANGDTEMVASERLADLLWRPVGRQNDTPNPNHNDRPPLAFALRAASIHLSVTYDGSQSEGARVTYDPKLPLTPVETLDLNRLVPRTRFFVTELKTSAYEYPIVRVIVSVTQSDGLVIQSALSPTFNATAERFLSQFVGLSAAKQHDRERLALSIAGLLREITDRGSLRIGAFRDDGLVIELHHTHLHWRDIQFYFAPAGNLERIRMVNPRSD